MKKFSVFLSFVSLCAPSRSWCYRVFSFRFFSRLFAFCLISQFPKCVGVCMCVLKCVQISGCACTGVWVFSECVRVKLCAGVLVSLLRALRDALELVQLITSEFLSLTWVADRQIEPNYLFNQIGDRIQISPSRFLLTHFWMTPLLWWD